MKVKNYSLLEGRLREQADPARPTKVDFAEPGERWHEVQDAGPEELRRFLEPFELHPLQMKRCIDSVDNPGVVSFRDSVLMEYPAVIGEETTHAAYLTILLKGSVLVTIRHGAIPEFDHLVGSLTDSQSPPLLHLPQIIYMILDHFTDMTIELQVGIRDQMMSLSSDISLKPDSVSADDFTRLRSRVENLGSLLENQIYCITGLNACDHEGLQDPHRKAYIQDLLSETEIAQRGVDRLESRLKDLYGDYLAVGNGRVEKRLRLLTIISAITLPLGLVAGLLGMNVGGLPGTEARSGFLVVSAIMILIVAAEFWYFKRKGWFD